MPHEEHTEHFVHVVVPLVGSKVRFIVVPQTHKFTFQCEYTKRHCWCFNGERHMGQDAREAWRYRIVQQGWPLWLITSLNNTKDTVRNLQVLSPQVEKTELLSYKPASHSPNTILMQFDRTLWLPQVHSACTKPSCPSTS